MRISGPRPRTYTDGRSIKHAAVKDKYGSDAEFEDSEEEDSEDLESEDEDGEELTPAVDVAILRTLARIKGRDPAIYDTEAAVFQGRSCIRKTCAVSNAIYISQRNAKSWAALNLTQGRSKTRYA